MSPTERVVFLICADAALTQQFVSELVATGRDYQLPLAVSIAQARRAFRRASPTAILLDESAMLGAGFGGAKSPEKRIESLEPVVARLTGWAPVIVLAAPERQAELAFLITSGAVDFVARVGSFLPIVAGFLERRVRMAELQASQGESGASPPEGPPADFGEILRHEVNNPLTGILGNAELLLAEYKKKNADRMSGTMAVQRLQTIADLAVRLRETVRRLSNAWESGADHADMV